MLWFLMDTTLDESEFPVSSNCNVYLPGLLRVFRVWNMVVPLHFGTGSIYKLMYSFDLFFEFLRWLHYWDSR